LTLRLHHQIGISVAQDLKAYKRNTVRWSTFGSRWLIAELSGLSLWLMMS